MENYINEVNRNVLYKVTIKYKGTDKIPTGILIEAKSIDGELNICQFCYNVERYIKFDYKDGSIIYNHDYLNKIKVKLKNIKERTKKDKTQQAVNEKIIIPKRNYILNIITNECHYDKDCEKLYKPGIAVGVGIGDGQGLSLLSCGKDEVFGVQHVQHAELVLLRLSE